MSVVEDFLKKMKMVNEDDYDDYDDYDEYDDEEEDDEILNTKKKPKMSLFKTRTKAEEEDEYDDEEDDLPDPDDDDMEDTYVAPAKKETRSGSRYSYSQNNKVVGMNSAPQKKSQAANAEVCMIMPKSYDDANTIADVLLSHKAVVLNLEGIDMAAAQRIIDFASGSCYTVGGNLQKISKKIFIVVPSDMNLSGDFDQLLGDMIDLNSVNMLK